VSEHDEPLTGRFPRGAIRISHRHVFDIRTGRNTVRYPHSPPPVTLGLYDYDDDGNVWFPPGEEDA
jgi:hypothetical protein